VKPSNKTCARAAERKFVACSERRSLHVFSVSEQRIPSSSRACGRTAVSAGVQCFSGDRRRQKNRFSSPMLS
jgi:hypothetical protein